MLALQAAARLSLPSVRPCLPVLWHSVWFLQFQLPLSYISIFTVVQMYFSKLLLIVLDCFNLINIGRIIKKDSWKQANKILFVLEKTKLVTLMVRYSK